MNPTKPFIGQHRDRLTIMVPDACVTAMLRSFAEFGSIRLSEVCQVSLACSREAGR